jgi:hypothetical protein
VKFLIDECLSPELAKRAEAAGHDGSSHVTWLGRSGASDRELKPFILAGDWTFVTRNAVDFRVPPLGGFRRPICERRPSRRPGVPRPEGMDLDMQLDLFDEALSELAHASDQPGAGDLDRYR